MQVKAAMRGTLAGQDYALVLHPVPGDLRQTMSLILDGLGEDGEMFSVHAGEFLLRQFETVWPQVCAGCYEHRSSGDRTTVETIAKEIFKRFEQYLYRELHTYSGGLTATVVMIVDGEIVVSINVGDSPLNWAEFVRNYQSDRDTMWQNRVANLQLEIDALKFQNMSNLAATHALKSLGGAATAASLQSVLNTAIPAFDDGRPHMVISESHSADNAEEWGDSFVDNDIEDSTTMPLQAAQIAMAQDVAEYDPVTGEPLNDPEEYWDVVDDSLPVTPRQESAPLPSATPSHEEAQTQAFQMGQHAAAAVLKNLEAIRALKEVQQLGAYCTSTWISFSNNRSVIRLPKGTRLPH